MPRACSLAEFDVADLTRKTAGRASWPVEPDILRYYCDDPDGRRQRRGASTAVRRITTVALECRMASTSTTAICDLGASRGPHVSRSVRARSTAIAHRKVIELMPCIGRAAGPVDSPYSVTDFRRARKLALEPEVAPGARRRPRRLYGLLGVIPPRAGAGWRAPAPRRACPGARGRVPDRRARDQQLAQPVLERARDRGWRSRMSTPSAMISAGVAWLPVRNCSKRPSSARQGFAP